MEVKKRKGLGRGLDALFNDVQVDQAVFNNSRVKRAGEIVEDSVQTDTSSLVMPTPNQMAPSSTSTTTSSNTPATQPTAQAASPRKLPIDKLQPGKFQPRTKFNEESLATLADSIKNHGVLQPLLVRPIANGMYEIIAGERRWRASQLAQVHELPVVIKEMDDSTALEIGLIENLQREDLSPIEEASGYQRLIDEFAYTQEDLARQLGKSRSQVTNTLRLLKLSNYVKEYIEEGSITAGHARALVNSDRADEIARMIVKKGLSVRQTEKMVKAVSEGKTLKAAIPAKAPKFQKKDVDVLALEEKMTNLLGMKFSLQSSGEGGMVNIEYSTLEQLDDLLEKLSISK